MPLIYLAPFNKTSILQIDLTDGTTQTFLGFSAYNYSFLIDVPIIALSVGTSTSDSLLVGTAYAYVMMPFTTYNTNDSTLADNILLQATTKSVAFPLSLTSPGSSSQDPIITATPQILTIPEVCPPSGSSANGDTLMTLVYPSLAFPEVASDVYAQSNTFTFAPADALAGDLIDSGLAIASGFIGPCSVSIVNGSYRIRRLSGTLTAYTTAVGYIYSGESIQVSNTASTTVGNRVTTQLTLGANVSNFVITTVATITDPSFSYVKFLSHFEGAFTDVCGSTITSTTGESTTTSNFKFGTACASLSGSSASNKVTVAPSSNFALTGDFTVELQTYLSSYVAGNIFSTGVANTQTGLALAITATGILQLSWNSGTGWVWPISSLAVTGAGAVPLNQWSYIVLSRIGTTLNLYVNGALMSSTTVTGGNATSMSLFIGGYPATNAASATALVDEFRITKGLGRYSGPTIPMQSYAFPNS